ncbi:helix-turn-helix domain-containing protein [Tumebacillus sp. ITR2]|uniref:Helix-turn-helix domain-containing protein n=1 Tax=Tumebacillus amylolyticus TaxID=2801339 RepID=A0ABS1J6N8_9BACL|nr:helix-turn-helix domain-containing protein [Tumebacillus amylolyticus]
MAVDLDVDERNRIIGDNLRKYRQLKGLTQDELADGLCSVSQLSKVENGKTYLKRTMLKQMADRLDVPLERIESADALLEELTELLQLAKDYYTARNVTKSLEHLEQVIEKCEEFGYSKLLVDALHEKCYILLLEKKAHGEVMRLVEQVLERKLYQTPSQKMLMLLDIGQAYDMSGDQQAAFDCYLRADEEYEFIEAEGEHSKLRYAVSLGLAKYHCIMGNYRASMRYAEKAERVAVHTNTHLYRIRSHYFKAIPLRRMGETQKAEQIYLEALKETHDNSLLVDVAIISNNLGEIYQERGELGPALQFYQRSYNMFNLVGAGLQLFQPLLHMAELACQNEDHGKAQEFIQEIFTICDQEEGRAYRERASGLRLLAQVKLSLQDTKSFEDHMLQALRIYQDHNVWDAAYEVAVEMAEHYSQFDSARSVELFRQAVEYNKTVKSLRR